jgi:UDP-N-acetylmuramoyl-tripeptide--D-alanyl-D-alanine ligase
MEPMQSSFVSGALGAAWEGAAPPERLCGVTRDSRECGAGWLYFALPGTRADGHDFLGAVASAGGAAVIAADCPAEKIPSGLAFLRVASPRAALLELGGAHRRRFGGVKVAGVTGSVGKTTTRRLLAAMLRRCGKTCETTGNYNNDIGLPLSLFGLDADTAFGVFEAGISHPGEMAPLAGAMLPDVAVFTPPGEAHIGNFGSVEGIIREKAGLAAGLGERGGTVVLGDAAREAGYAQFAAGARLVRCRVEAGGADPGAADGAWDYLGRVRGAGDEMDVEEREGGARVRLPVPAPGGFMALNLLRAAAAARTMGAGWGDIAAAAAGYGGWAGRWETVRLANGATAIHDAYNANPLSMAEGLAALARRHAGQRRFVVVGPMLELGEEREAEAHRAVGEQLAREGFAAAVVLAREEPGAEGDAAARALAAPLLAAGRGNDVLLTGDGAEAAAFLAGRMEAGDVLYLKASRGVRAERVLEHFEREKGPC